MCGRHRLQEPKQVSSEQPARGRAKQRRHAVTPPLPPLNPLHYDDEGVMIGHRLVPMRAPMDGVFWCSLCGGHPDDPIHQAG